jgi:tetratricopeptide (TPR) repeat protein
MRLAEIVLLSKQLPVARQYAERLLVLDAKDEDDLFFSAKVELASGNANAAIATINKLEALLQVKSASFYLMQGSALMANAAYQPAARAFEAAIALDPRNALAHASLSDAQRKAGDLIAAREAWLKYGALSPQS